MAIAHVTTAEGASRAIAAGVDGLAHLVFDHTASVDFAARMASSGSFVVPTLVTISTAFGDSASALAGDPRVRSKLSNKWLDSLTAWESADVGLLIPRTLVTTSAFGVARSPPG